MKRKIKISFIGCGKIFNKHYLAINRLKKIYEIDAVCDNKLNNFSKFNFSKKIKIFNNLKELLLNTNSDVYVILTPSGYHYDNILEVGKKSKSIIVEKPLVINYDQSKKINVYANKNKLNLFVVKQNRYNPSITYLKHAIDTGRFGKIFFASIRLRWKRDNKYFNSGKWRGTWKNDGGVLANQASHHLDLIYWLIGDVKSVFTKSLKINNSTKAIDTIVSIIKFKNGTLGTVEATTATSPEDLGDTISILGSKGTVEIGGYAASQILYWKFFRKKPIDIKIQKLINKKNKINKDGHFNFYKDIHNFINKKKNNIVRHPEAIKTIKLIDKIYASSETSKEVFFNDSNYSVKLGR